MVYRNLLWNSCFIIVIYNSCKLCKQIVNWSYNHTNYTSPFPQIRPFFLTPCLSLPSTHFNALIISFFCPFVYTISIVSEEERSNICSLCAGFDKHSSQMHVDFKHPEPEVHFLTMISLENLRICQIWMNHSWNFNRGKRCSDWQKWAQHKPLTCSNVQQDVERTVLCVHHISAILFMWMRGKLKVIQEAWLFWYTSCWKTNKWLREERGDAGSGKQGWGEKPKRFKSATKIKK